MSRATPSSAAMIPAFRATPPAGAPARRVRFVRPRLEEWGQGSVRHDLSPAALDAGGRVKSALSLTSLTPGELEEPPVLELHAAEGELRLSAVGFRQETTELGSLSVGVYPASQDLLRRLANGGVAVRLELSGRLRPLALDARDRRRFEEFLLG